ncbi:MAG: hypothetical protein ACFCUJ_14135 [Thiotrichales bacterium]
MATDSRKQNPVDSKTPESYRTPATPRVPRGPLIVIGVVIATVLWVYWLKETRTPRPLPEVPPHRQVPKDAHHPQDPRPALPSREAAGESR